MMSRIAAAVVSLFLAGTPAIAQRVEVHEAGRVLLLTSSSDGSCLMLAVDGREGPFGECSNEGRGEAVASGDVKASVVERNCGATVDFATHIRLQSPDAEVSVAVFAGRVPATLSWTAERLSVRHAPVDPDRIYQRTTAALGTTVTYEAVGAPAPPSEYLAYSSFNYGATGRASGLPAEVLLRAAGWSQEASGLYRAPWGRWTGSAPYGDDPEGSAQIQNGMRYYEEHKDELH